MPPAVAEVPSGNTSTSGTYRDFVFTAWAEPEFIEEKMKYLIYQKERCPETGRIHYQGFMITNKAIRFTGAKKLLPPCTHIERRRGTIDECINYCSKGESRIEEPKIFGSKPRPGARTDLENVCKKIIEGKTPEETAEEHPMTYVQYNRGLEKLYHAIHGKPRKEMTELIWICGETGKGKSKQAWEQYPNAFSKNHEQWWDGYRYQETVIIDDVTRKTRIDLGELLRLADRYPYQVPFKGGYCQFNSKKIIITSNFKPDEIYGWNQNYNALLRRMTIIEMN